MNIRTEPTAGVVCALFLVMVGPLSAAAQSISGTVVQPDGKEARGVQVTFRDSRNAETIAVTTADYAGAYLSGELPAGNYRVRFSGHLLAPVFFGALGDDFCSGADVTVVPGTPTTGIDVVMRPDEPSVIDLRSGTLRGVVLDAVTGLPLPAIRVSMLDAWNGETIAELATSGSGEYLFEYENLSSPIRVRFSDPESRYFPQFFGATGLDEFCLAESLVPDGKERTADALMQPIPPGELTQNLLDEIGALGLPETVTTSLAAPLIQATDMLTDGNAANDASVCGRLTAFVTRVDMQARRGQLSPEEAAALKGSAEAVAAVLGCG